MGSQGVELPEPALSLTGDQPCALWGLWEITPPGLELAKHAE